MACLLGRPGPGRGTPDLASLPLARQVIDRTADPVIAKDLDGRFVLVNAAAARLIFRRPADEILGRRDADLLPAATARRIEADDRRALASRVPFTYEEVLETPTGSQWLQTTKGPLLDASGRPVGVFLIARDITRRRQAQQALAEREALFRLLTENATDFITQYRVTAPRAFEYVSPSAEHVTGYAASEWLEDPHIVPRIVHPDDRPILERWFSDPPPGGSRITVRILQKDGSMRWIESALRPIRDRAGRLTAIDGIARDVTERTRSEQRLRDLLAVTEAALTEVDLDPLLDELMARVRSMFEVESAALLLLDDSGRELWLRAAVGLHDALPKGLHFAPSRGIAREILARGRAVIVDDLWNTELSSSILRDLGIRSLVGAPVRAHGRTIGIAHIAARTERRFTESDAAALQLIVDRLGLAIEHTRLFEAERRARADAEAAEERLRSELEFVGAVTASLSEGVFRLDRSGRVLFANPAAGRILGYRVGELLGSDLHSLVHRHSRDGAPLPRAECPQLQVLRTGIGSRTDDEVFLRKDGAEVPVGVATNPVRREGAVESVVVSFWDITERKRAERHEHLLARVSELLGAGLDIEDTLARITRLPVPELADGCVVDLLEDGRVRRAAAAHRDAEQERLLRLPPPGLLAESASPIMEVLRTGKPLLVASAPGLPQLLTRLDREDREVLERIDVGGFVVVPLAARGRTVGALSLLAGKERRPFDDADLGLAVELAERAAMALDNALLYRGAQEASRAREEVLAIVSHDLKNPLNAALLGLNALDQRLPAEVAPSRRQLALVRRATERIEHLVSDLLDAARIEAGRFAVTPRREDAEALVAETVEVEAPVADEKGLRLDRRVARDLPGVWCDREAVLRVLANLVGNAVRHTPPGGRVLVAADAEGGEVRFAVADTGSGIDPANLEHLFDRYWQGREKRGGAGLGLYIARGIVEAHGGRIWVDSKPGLGSTFFFSLPAAAAPEDRPAHAAE